MSPCLLRSKEESMNELTVQARSLVPFKAEELATTGTQIAEMVTWAAEKQIREETPDFDRDYNGAQREGMISQRAAELLERMNASVQYARAYLHEELLEKGVYHPDLRGDVQELVDEICSKATQQKSGQVKYFADRIIPKAVEYGVNVDVWMRDTTIYKTCEIVPAWKEFLEDKTFPEEELKKVFVHLVWLSTQSINAIRAGLLTSGPREFEIHRNKAGDGYEWLIPAMTADTNRWLARQVQPYGRFSDNGTDPEEEEIPDVL